MVFCILGYCCYCFSQVQAVCIVCSVCFVKWYACADVKSCFGVLGYSCSVDVMLPLDLTV